MAITTAWAFAVYVGVIAATALGSGAHINPAVTLAFAVNGNIGWDLVAPYIGGQFLGAIIGALLVWIHYLDHFAVTLDEDAKRACFCIIPRVIIQGETRYKSDFGNPQIWKHCCEGWKRPPVRAAFFVSGSFG